MKKLLLAIFSIAALFTACDDTTDTIGSTLTKKEDLVTVSDGIFKIHSRSVIADSVLAKSIIGYLGKVKDPETGAYINSNFITQFHTFENFSFPNTSILPKGTIADSCQVRLFYDSFYGDSLTSMKATLYELAKPIEENTNYYSTFSPEENGLLRLSDNAVKVSKTYTLASGNYTDSLRNSGEYVNNIFFNLNDPYTDKDGNSYNNYGTYLMKKYYENPDNFKNSYNFIHNVCPGFYIKSENGVGCMAYIYLSQLNTYFTYKDSVEHVGVANFSGTEEVRQISQVTNDASRIRQLAADNSCTYIKAPAGIYTELTLPVEEICANHENDSITSAKVTLSCLAKTNSDQYTFKAPTTILMIRADKAEEFFKDNKLADNRTSYLAAFTKTSNSYSFNNIGELIKSMYKEMPQNPALREQWKLANPSWNKVLLIPVSASYYTIQTSSGATRQVLSNLSNDMSLSSVQLIGGSENPNDDITISVIYSKFADK